MALMIVHFQPGPSLTRNSKLLVFEEGSLTSAGQFMIRHGYLRRARDTIAKIGVRL